MLYRMTYGILPTAEQYQSAWDAKDNAGELRDGMFHFGNCKRVGSCALTFSELWRELEQAVAEGTDESLDWASCVLYCLGVEWI